MITSVWMHSARVVLIAALAAHPLEAQRVRSSAPIEGTWKLVAWRIGRDTLRSPDAQGVFGVRDGTIMWQVHATHGDTVVDRVGLGHYSVDATSFRYAYDSGLEVDKPRQGLAVVHDSLPFAGTRVLRRLPVRGEWRYATADTNQVYTVRHDSLWVVQNRQLSRVYVRARSIAARK